MKNSKLYDFVLTGLFVALIFVVTAYFPRIPTARGYIHVGDAVIYLAASVLPLPLSAIAAGLGGMFADVLTGYAIWAPYTLVIKACLTFAFTSKNGNLLCGRNVLATIMAFPITIGGYYLAALLMTGNAIVPLAEIPANAVQSAGSLAIYISFATCMDKAKIRARFAGGTR
ncbi:MAG: TIGR04002 family protein [Synergistaceae bacterium]|nr:TIGR04002 family protein [Synergistaceae bacterium]